MVSWTGGRFGVLGALRVGSRSGLSVGVAGRSRSAALLAALLLHPNQDVSVDELTSVTWGDYQPTTGRASLHTQVARLRRMLVAHGIDPAQVQTVASGYRVDVDDEDLDSLQLAGLVRAADQCSDDPGRSALLRQAVSLRSDWDVLANVEAPELRRRATEQIERLWCPAAERSFTLRIAANDPQDLRDLHRTLVAASGAHPANTAFREQRDEVGALLRSADVGPGQVYATPASGRVVRPVAALPSAVPLRTRPTPRTGRLHGRDDDRSLLSAHLHSDPHAVAVVTGLPGSGKTALATTVAHGLTGSPEVLIVDAGDEQQAEAHVVALLEQQHSAAPAPVLILDDARSCEQVQSLLAVVSGRVVVTSVRSLAGLAVTSNALVCRIGGLDTAAAREMLVDTLGRRRVEAAVAACDDLIARCSGMPLPLRLAAARLAQRPTMRIEDMLGVMGGDAGATLGIGQDGVSFAGRMTEFFDRLEPDLRTAFRTVCELGARGVTTEPDSRRGVVSVRHSQCEAALTPVRARTLLERMIDHNLVDEVAAGSFRIDAIVHAFASARPVGPLV